jgi:hypothetical protein
MCVCLIVAECWKASLVECAKVDEEHVEAIAPAVGLSGCDFDVYSGVVGASELGAEESLVYHCRRVSGMRRAAGGGW